MIDNCNYFYQCTSLYPLAKRPGSYHPQEPLEKLMASLKNDLRQQNLANSNLIVRFCVGNTLLLPSAICLKLYY